MDAIDELLQRVETPPPAPKLLPQLLVALSDIDADVAKAVDLITYDPALTVKILQVCNSAYYAMPARVSNVADAVNRIGFLGVYTIAAMASSEMLMKKSPQSVIDADAVWRHLVSSAFAAQGLAQRLGLNAGMLFTAGLLHDIGKLPLAEVLQGDYQSLITDQQLFARPLDALESASFGLTHAEVGARLLENWSFAPEFVAAVRWHHDPAAAGGHATLAACVELADLVAHSLDADDEAPFADLEAGPALAVTGLTLADLLQQREKVQEKFEMIDLMCGALA